MAKKKPVAKKAKSNVKKKSSSSTKRKSVSKKKPVSPKKNSSKKKPYAKNNAIVIPDNVANNGTHQQNIPLLPTQLIEDTIEGIQNLMADFADVANNNLTTMQRRRKIGAGVRNYGFIDKVSDLAEANPQYAQFFKINDLKNCIRNIEVCRDLVVLLQSFARLVSNTMLVYSDDAFTMALIYYNMVREMSRRGDPTAMELFRMLQIFFKRRKPVTAEPTERELERDLHALIHGKKDGKIVIENITPKTSGGARKVVDDVRKSRAMIKEQAEAEFEN